MKVSIKKLRMAGAIAASFKDVVSKFGYACLRAEELIGAAIKKENKLLADMQNELALVDDKTKACILGSNKEYAYTPANTRKIQNFIEEQGEIEIEYEPYIAKDFTEIKDSLSLLKALNGIIVDIDLEKYIEEKNSL